MELKENRFMYWILAVPFSLVLSCQPAGCCPAPAKVSMPSAVLVKQQDEEAQQQADAVAAMYEDMSDEERMHGVVYEPIDEEVIR
jgi:hypothetical protein